MPRPTPRRTFLRHGLAGALAAGVAPRFLPTRLLGAAAPSGKLTLGCIGVGAHGFGVNLNQFLQEEDCRIVAVCDVFADRRQRAREAVDRHYGGPGCAEFRDFRDLLARPDIDAVVISTPDHWHVPMALLALAAGKAVFCEKPTLTIAEGRALADAVARRPGAFFATGLEDRAVIQYHKLAEVVRNGGIGRLRRIEVGLPVKPLFPLEAPAPVPEGLDYELWLGPAPFRPYSPTLTDAQCWRQIRDFSGGSLTDWGAHLVDTAQVAAGVEDTGPVAVRGQGEFPTGAFNTTARTYALEYTYANGVVLTVGASQPSIRLEGDAGWVGNRGWLGRLEGSDPNVFRQTWAPEVNRLWPRRPREHRDFLDSLRAGRAPMYPAEALHRLSTTLHLGAIAMELGRPLRWDPAAERFLDDPAADALRSRKSRDDWQRRG